MFFFSVLLLDQQLNEFICFFNETLFVIPLSVFLKIPLSKLDTQLLLSNNLQHFTKLVAQ